MLTTLIILNIIFFIFCDKESDRVNNLFGDLYNGEMFSGYLATDSPNRRLHYIFIPSQNNPINDPVVLWLNGGPGCSSLLGFIQEHGPVIIPDYSSQFQVNQYSWNKNANMIYLESPAGVGFSINTDPNDFKWDDNKSGKDNRLALIDFFKRFPEYKKNDFYISGESYAGVYVPKLASLLLNDKDINLKGILVGNGLTDLSVDIEHALIDFAYEHALYSIELKSDFDKYCNNTVSTKCNQVRKNIRESLQGINIYDIYRECPKDLQKHPHTVYNTMKSTLKKISHMNKLKKGLFMLDEEEEGIWPDGCMEDQYPIIFFNELSTKKLLHVQEDIIFQQCNNLINGNYTFGESLNIYTDSIIPAKLRILFFSGDTDGAVPFNGSIKWIPKLGLDIIKEYRSWNVDGQTAGYVQEYKGFTYATIKGTGHMAPQWKRKETFIMFNSFLKGEPLPE